MGLLGTTEFEARIALWNLDDADPDAGQPVRATVEALPLRDGLDETSSRVAFAYLVSLTAVTLLRNSRNQPETTAPFMHVVKLAADELFASESSARSLRLRDLMQYDLVSARANGDFDPSAIMFLGIPELGVAADGGAFKVMNARLMVARQGGYFGAVQGVGNAYQAAYGFFALLEHMARTQPYEEVVVPAAVALAEISMLYEDDLNGKAPGFSQTTQINQIVCRRLGRLASR